MPLTDIVEEAERIIAAAHLRNVPARLIGGLAVRLHVPSSEIPLFNRTYKDIDLVVPTGHGKPLGQLLGDLGYVADQTFNTINGHSRLLFYDPPHKRQVDVFVGTFEMCHAIPLGDRIALTPNGLPLAELLLTKLQIVELNPKDRADLLTILYHHELTDDDIHGINQAQVAALCAADWGLWRTTKLNLERIEEGLEGDALTDRERGVIASRVRRLWERIDAEPKSRKWKMRNRVGDKVRWYEEPEEVDR